MNIDLNMYKYKKLGGAVMLGELIPKKSSLPSFYVIRKTDGIYLINKDNNSSNSYYYNDVSYQEKETSHFQQKYIEQEYSC